MADRSLPSSIRSVLRRLKAKEVKHLPDAELLGRYVATRDEAAFTTLVGRHGPAVLGVCRRVLHGHDVDDVFQATFLALAKEARTVRRREAVGPWLYEVAYHAALRAKARRARSRRVEQFAATAEGSNPPDEVVYRDVQRVLDEELHRLPERLRRALVLVHLLGHVQAEAAQELGITDRALRKRLRAGRDRLRLGLVRRGVTLTAAALTAALDRPAAAGPVAPDLVRPTVDSVLAYAAGQAGAVPPATVSLAMAGTGGWLAMRFKLIGVLAVPVLATLVLTASALTTAGRHVSSPPPAPAVKSAGAAAGRTAVLTGRVLGADGLPVPHAAVTALVRRPWQSADRGLHDDVVARGAADADGRYRLTVPADFPSWSPDRRVTLLAHSAGHAPVTGAVSLGGPPTSADLRLSGGAAVTGRLLAPDGQPAGGVRLAVVRLGIAVWGGTQGGEARGRPAGWPADVTTDAAGAFRLEGLPAGENLWLQVRDDRFALTTFRVTAGAAEPGAVTLAGPRLLTGRITAQDTGRPLAGARVAVIVGPDRTTFDYYTALAAAPEIAAAAPSVEVDGRTDADGRYRLRLPPGTAYHVYAYPPEGAAYIAYHWTVTWSEGETQRDRGVVLTPGIPVRGRVVEGDGRPISGACVLWMSDPSAAPPPGKNVLRDHRFPDGQAQALMFADTATVSDADGHFCAVVPLKPVVFRVFGPTADYRLDDYGYQRCPQCGKEHLRPGEHSQFRIDPTEPTAAEPIRVTLRRGVTVTGRAVGPDGEPIREGVLVCRTIAQPLRKPAPRTVPIRDGTFALPGCIAGRVYPVLLLDAARELATVAEIRVVSNQPPNARGVQATVPTIRLDRCGTAAVRLVDGAGQPVAGDRPSVWFWLADDRPVGPHVAGNGPWSNPMDASWVDPRHYLPGPATGADGLLNLPALVPGLQYQVKFTDRGGRPLVSAPFRVAPGQDVRLPDVVVPPEDGGDADHQLEKPLKEAHVPAPK